jgi:hypothetical protein
MKILALLTAGVLSAPLISCGNGASEVAHLSRTVDSLRVALDSTSRELEDLKFGPDRLLASAKTAFSTADYDKAISEARELSRRHPSSLQKDSAERLIVSSEAAKERIVAEQRRKAEEEARAEKARLASALRKMQSSYDQVREVTHYFDRNVSQYVNIGGSKVLLYMAKSKYGSPNLYFSIRYQADDWLFIESYLIKADDQTFTVTPGFQEVERDNGYGGIWEWYSTLAGSRELDIVRAIISAKKAVIRYDGKQYYRDRTITSSEKQSLKNVLDAYAALGGS